MNTLQDLMRPPPGMDFDLSQPAGEPALAPAHSVSWKIFANPVSLFIGGVAGAGRAIGTVGRVGPQQF